MSKFSQVYWMLVKDLMVESRRGFEILASMGFISAAALVIAQAAFESLTPKLVIPAFWITILFIAIFTSTTAFVREADKKTLPGLRLIPISPSVIFLSKTLFTFLLILGQGFIEIILLAVFSSQWYLISDRVLITFVVSSLHISAIAAFASALVMYSEGRAFLIPMLIFVLTAPIIPTVLTLANPSYPFEMVTFAILLLETLIMVTATAVLSEFVLSV